MSEDDNDIEDIHFSMPPKSSRKVVIRDAEWDTKLEQERKDLREIVETLFHHPMVADVRACRSCGVPVLHMEHLKLDEAKSIEAKAWKLLNLDPVAVWNRLNGEEEA